MKIVYSITLSNGITFLLDTIKDTTVVSSSQISSVPMASGEIISDHKYEEPITVTLTGTISLTSFNKLSPFSNSFETLQAVESIFEMIKKSGDLCTLVKVNIDETGNKRATFAKRTNMVLQSINWTERINTLDFTFTFQQIRVVNISNPPTDVTDTSLPSIAGVTASNFTETFMDWDAIDALVTEIGTDLGFIEVEFAQYAWKAVLGLSSYIGAIGLGVAAGSAIAAAGGIGAVVEGLAAAAGASVAGGSVGGPVGTAIGLIAATALLLAAAGFLLYQTISDVQKDYQFREKAFRYYKDDRKMQEELQRFEDFLGSIHNSLMNFNNQIEVYQISENREQTCIINLFSTYYRFELTKNNITERYKLNVYDMDDILVKSLEDITVSPKSLDTCTELNYLFKIKNTGEYVYLLNQTKGVTTTDKYINSLVPSNTNYDKNDLTNYYVIATQIKPEELTANIREIITNSIKRS